jgi:hypothetical protein
MGKKLFVSQIFCDTYFVYVFSEFSFRNYVYVVPPGLFLHWAQQSLKSVLHLMYCIEEVTGLNHVRTSACCK